jgi:hypothetical protein
VEYRFSVEADSTVKISKEKQLSELERIMTAIGKFQNSFKDDPRIEVNWGAMLKAYDSLTDIPGADQFVIVKDGPSPQEQELQQQNQELQQQLQKQETQSKRLYETLSYKDAPEDIKRQIEAQAGLEPSQGVSPAATDQALKHSTIMKNEADVQQAQDSHHLAVNQALSQEELAHKTLDKPKEKTTSAAR